MQGPKHLSHPVLLSQTYHQQAGTQVGQPGPDEPHGILASQAVVRPTSPGCQPQSLISEHTADHYSGGSSCAVEMNQQVRAPSYPSNKQIHILK